MIGHPSVMRFFRLGSDDVNGDIMNKIITVMLLLSILIISGCTSKPYTERLAEDEASSGIGIAGYGKPACQGTNPKFWDNCTGTVRPKLPTPLHAHGVWIDGKRMGPGYYIYDGQTCALNWKINTRTGWRICTRYINGIRTEVSKEYVVDGERSEVDERLMVSNTFKATCADLGFKSGTAESGNCVLRLMELDASKNNNQGYSHAPGNYTAQPTTSTADRLEGVAQILSAFTKTPTSTSAPTNRSNPPPMSKTCSYKSGVYEWSEVTNLLMCPSSSNKGGIIGVLAP
jgi:hypothetical protein